jgi:hypothetical protein
MTASCGPAKSATIVVRKGVFDVRILTGAGPRRTYTRPLQTMRTRHSSPAQRALAELRGTVFDGPRESSSPQDAVPSASVSPTRIVAPMGVRERGTPTVCRERVSESSTNRGSAPDSGFAATASAYPLGVGDFELSERWCGWSDVDVIFVAARAAIEAGPFDPPLCEVVFDEEFDPFTVDTLEQAREHLKSSRVRSMDIILSHVDEDEARVALSYSGGRLQLNGHGSDWARARAAYDAARAHLASHFGITTFKLPELPRDTVGETRKRLVIEELEAALENVDSGLDDR